MSENPAQWGPATRIINDCISQHFAPENMDVCGFSLPMFIADALRRADYLGPDDIWEEPDQ